MARYIKILQDVESPNGKVWVKGSVRMVGTSLAEKMIEDKKAEYSTGPEKEFVEAVKKVTRKRK